MSPVERIKQDIRDYFGDTARPQQATLDGLEEIIDQAEGFADAVRHDLLTQQPD